jgi:predicted nucleic acid-binding Zn ribbon protein
LPEREKQAKKRSVTVSSRVRSSVMNACVVCGGLLPAGSRSHRRYCSARCRQRAYVRRAAERAATAPITAEQAQRLLAEGWPEQWGEQVRIVGPPGPARF